MQDDINFVTATLGMTCDSKLSIFREFDRATVGMLVRRLQRQIQRLMNIEATAHQFSASNAFVGFNVYMLLVLGVSTRLKDSSSDTRLTSAHDHTGDELARHR